MDEKENDARKLIIETEIPAKKDAIFMKRMASGLINGAITMANSPKGRTTNPMIGIIIMFERSVTVDNLLK